MSYSQSSDDDNLIKKVRNMPTSNILTFEEFVKTALESYVPQDNLNPEDD